MYINHRPKNFTSRHPHIEQAAKRHRFLLNLFGAVLLATGMFVLFATALLIGEL